MNDLQKIEIGLLDNHPQNPRLVMREDVIDGIAAQIKANGAFDPAHALLVRPLNGRYQIVRGHHRKAGAERAGLDDVPCWVREMDDAEAYMQLGLGNVQGELSPLEIGRHVLGAVEPGERGRGNVGGLGEYGRQVGKTTGYITQVRQAAEVFGITEKMFSQLNIFLDKAQHLSAIHGAPRELWPLLVEWIITPNGNGNAPSAKQTEELVKQVNKFNVPQTWAAILPLADIAQSFMATGKPTAENITSLVNGYDGIAALITAHQERLDPDLFTYTVDGFAEWLTGGIGTYAWDLREVQRYRSEVIAQAQAADKPRRIECKAGEWYQLGAHKLYCGDTSQPEFWRDLPQASFAFADPPYNANADIWDTGFTWAHDWLIDKAELVAVTPGISAIKSFFKDDTDMPYTWSVACWIKNGMTRGALGFGNWVYIALFSRPELSMQSAHGQQQDHFEVTIKTGETDKTSHKGRKPQALVMRLLEMFTQQGDTVIDPFLGSGTTLFAAQEMGRFCIGGEIDPAFCSEIIDRWHEETSIQARRLYANTL